VNTLTKGVPLTQYEFDTLVDFQFNTGALTGSTLLKRLKKLEYNAIPEELKKWVYGDKEVTEKDSKTGKTKKVIKKVVLSVLVKRREAEVKLWSTADYGLATRTASPTPTPTPGLQAPTPTPTATPTPTPTPVSASVTIDSASCTLLRRFDKNGYDYGEWEIMASGTASGPVGTTVEMPNWLGYRNYTAEVGS
jgi:hypothetical protein